MIIIQLAKAHAGSQTQYLKYDCLSLKEVYNFKSQTKSTFRRWGEVLILVLKCGLFPQMATGNAVALWHLHHAHASRLRSRNRILKKCKFKHLSLFASWTHPLLYTTGIFVNLTVGHIVSYVRLSGWKLLLSEVPLHHIYLFFVLIDFLLPFIIPFISYLNCFILNHTRKSYKRSFPRL